MRCKGCNSQLTLIEYQARSADEAHSSSYRCPFCPLDITKFSNSIPKPHLYLKRTQRERKRTPLVNSSDSIDSRLLYVVSKRTSILEGRKLLEARCKNCVDKNSVLFKYYSSGPWKGIAVCQQNSRSIALNAQIVSVSYLCTNLDGGKDYVDFQYTKIDDYTVILQDNKVHFVHDVGSELDSAILDHLSVAYCMGFAPTNLSSYISAVMLGAMSNMNARAYDAASGDDYRDRFSTKPDGERMWLVHAGSTWLYCKRANFEVRNWEFDLEVHSSDSVSISPVIDIEFMLNLPPILIDVLLTSNMKVCPYDRDLEWIHTEMSRLREEFSYLSIVETREFFDTYKEAYDYSKRVKYPTDGIIAISPHGTDMKKLKPIKSIELRVGESYNLVTKENTALFKLDSASVYSVGDIVEIRFSISGSDFDIHETFHRPDKVSPNDNSAVQAVIASCNIQDSDSVVRTMMWRWSNKLRFYLYDKANSMNEEKNIVLDIGSGSGQSTDAFARVPGCSFILVEPDEASCNALARRLRTKDVFKDPRSITAAIPQLKRGTRRYHILNCTLEKILSDRSVTSGLKSIVKCAVSSFSTHYIIGDVDNVTSLGIPFIGCYYSYDGLDVGESIINTSGIQMTRTSDRRAVVKWGRDEPYEEPVVLSEDEPLNVTMIDALDVVPLDTGSQNQTVYNACLTVKILISK